MKKQQYLLLVFSLLLLLSLQSVTGFCAFKGEVITSDGLTVPEGTPIEISISSQQSTFYTETGSGSIPNFYVAVLRSCTPGQDKATLVSYRGSSRAEVTTLTSSPYTSTTLVLQENSVDSASPASGGSSGGGASGGGSSTGAQTAPKIITIRPGWRFTLQPFDIGVYVRDHIEHEFRIVNILDGITVAAVLDPPHAPVVLKQGEEQTLDLDGDGLFDLRVFVNGVLPESVTFTFREIDSKELANSPKPVEDGLQQEGQGTGEDTGNNAGAPVGPTIEIPSGTPANPLIIFLILVWGIVIISSFLVAKKLRPHHK